MCWEIFQLLSLFVPKLLHNFRIFSVIIHFQVQYLYSLSLAVQQITPELNVPKATSLLSHSFCDSRIWAWFLHFWVSHKAAVKVLAEEKVTCEDSTAGERSALKLTWLLAEFSFLRVVGLRASVPFYLIDDCMSSLLRKSLQHFNLINQRQQRKRVC